MLSLGVGLTSVPVLARRGPAYDPDALAFFARLTNQPTAARKALYNTLIKDLKSAGVWAKLDALYILAAADAQAARQNLVANAFNLTAVNAPTFTTDRGYTGDGSGAYLSTGFDPTTALSPKFALNDGHLGVWSRTDALAASYYDIGNSGAQMNPRGTSANALRGSVNSVVLSNFGANATSLGHFVLSRQNSSNVQGYQNGALLQDVVRASVATQAGSIMVLSNGTAFSARQISEASIGSGLSGGETTSFYAALNAYLTAVGGA